MTKISICPRCGIEFENTTNRTYCSISCANVRHHSEETKKKTSDTLKLYNKLNYDKIIIKSNNLKLKNEQKYLENPKYCPICNKVIPYNIKNKITCCNECYIEYQRIKALNQKYHGRGKAGWYKNFWCDSTYELAYVIYCLDHNIDIKRNYEEFEYTYNNISHKYIPDLIVNDELIEIKGYHTELVDIKLKSVNKPIKILYKEDLKFAFEYIKEKYNLSGVNVAKLYDDKNGYKYICYHCGKEFITYTKRKTNKVYCSRHCSGSRIKDKEYRDKISKSIKNFYNKN